MNNIFEESILSIIPHSEIAVYLDDTFLINLFIYRKTRNTDTLYDALYEFTEEYSKYELMNELIQHYENDDIIKLHWKFMGIQNILHMTIKKYFYYKQTGDHQEFIEIVRNLMQLIWLQENSPEQF